MRRYIVIGTVAVTLSACVAHQPLVPIGSETDSAKRAPVVVGETVPLVIQPAESAPARPSDAWESYLAEATVKTPSLEHEFVLTDAKQRVVGELQVLIARKENTFSDIARTFGLGYDDLVNANPGVDPWLPGAGTPILLPTRYILPDVPRRGIVLNIAAKRLYYFPPRQAGEPQHVITHPIGIGRVGWATPLGQSSVIAKAENPTWYVPRSVRDEHRAMGDPLPAVVPPGPDNPLGHRVLKLGMEGYLIHGTNQPYGVGMRVSHGCVRLYPENIETLYNAANIGTPVRIINEPVLAAWHGDTVVAQAFPILEDDELTPAEHISTLQSVTAAMDADDRASGQERLDQLLTEASGLVTRLTADDAPSRVFPVLVENQVEVDNPLTDDELAELMALAEEADAEST